MFFALGTCALVFFAILIVVRAERREPATAIVAPRMVPIDAPPGCYVASGYRLVDALVGMPGVAVVEERRTGNDVLAIGALDGERRVIATCRRDAVKHIAWADGGTSILWNRDGLERVHVDGGVVERLVGAVDLPLEIRSVIADPNGRRVFFTMRTSARGRSTAHVLDLERGETSSLGDDMHDADVEGADVVWARNFVVVSVVRLRSRLTQLWELDLDGGGGREIGAGWDHQLTVDPTGSIVLFEGGSRGTIERGGLHAWWKWLTTPAWAPGGVHVAGTSNGTAMWICELSRGDKVLEVIPAIAVTEIRAPVWSSDNRFVAFWLGPATKADRGARMFVVDRIRGEVWLAGESIRALAWRPS